MVSQHPKTMELFKKVYLGFVYNRVDLDYVTESFSKALRII